MRTAIIIQARLGSTRLPAKVLLPLPTRRRVIEEVVYQCEKVSSDFLVCVATPSQDCKIISDCLRNGSVSVIGYDGNEDDVLARYAYAARLIRAETIVRITADCPLIRWGVIHECIRLHRRMNADYTSNVYPSRSYPKGWDVEVFSRALLDRADAEATEAYDREHVTPWMQRECSAERASMALMKRMDDGSHERMVLDTLDDYRAIWAMMCGDSDWGDWDTNARTLILD